MLEQLINWDKSLLLYLNGMHSAFFDFIMFWASNKLIWIPFYLFLTYLVTKSYKIRTIDILICAAIIITLSDVISERCFKEVFHRLRPCQDPSINSMVHLVNGRCGGMYGFVSGHAANSFALAFFVIQILGKKIKYLTPCIIVWASLVSYSRIYLGVHFPLDVLCGGILGAFIGISIGKLFNWYYKKFVLKLPT